METLEFDSHTEVLGADSNILQMQLQLVARHYFSTNYLHAPIIAFVGPNKSVDVFLILTFYSSLFFTIMRKEYEKIQNGGSLENVTIGTTITTVTSFTIGTPVTTCNVVFHISLTVKQSASLERCQAVSFRTSLFCRMRTDPSRCNFTLSAKLQ